MLKKLLLIFLLYSTLSFANNIENIPGETDLVVKAKTLQLFTMAMESQKETISDLNMRVYKLQKELLKLQSKCTI